MSPSGIGFRPFSIPSALLVSLLLLSPACSTPDSTGLQETEPLEKQVQALTEQTRANEAQIQRLSQELQALQATLASLDNQIWARQSTMAKNLAEVRSDLLPSLTGQVESLAHTLQAVRDKLDENDSEKLRLQLDAIQATLARDQKERAGNETFAAFARQGMAVQLERTQTQLAQLQATVATLASRLDQAQAEQRQAFSAETAWLGALAGQLERYRQALSGKRSGPRSSTPPAP